MTKDPADYFRARELAEREAARIATCRAARLIHEELADRYAARVREASGPPPRAAAPARPRVSLAYSRPVASDALRRGPRSG